MVIQINKQKLTEYVENIICDMENKCGKFSKEQRPTIKQSMMDFHIAGMKAINKNIVLNEGK